MIQLRKSNERGHANHGWLDSYHTFSFADYYDRNFMAYRDLRVINEDKIAGGGGFPTHPHKDMEIITYVIAGALQHKDTLGNTEVIRPGEVQRMTAGTGIQHSEFNPDPNTPIHLLQIWILPNAKGLKPGYEQKSFADRIGKEDLTLVASNTGREGSVSLNQDVDLYAAKWAGAREVNFPLKPSRYAWLQMIKGSLKVNGQNVEEGDGLAVAQEPNLGLKSSGPAEFLLFDLA